MRTHDRNATEQEDFLVCVIFSIYGGTLAIGAGRGKTARDDCEAMAEIWTMQNTLTNFSRWNFYPGTARLVQRVMQAGSHSNPTVGFDGVFDL